MTPSQTNMGYIYTSYSNDEALISLFRGDASTDIYKQMASLIRNKPAESITSEERAVSSNSVSLNHIDKSSWLNITSSLLKLFILFSNSNK